MWRSIAKHRAVIITLLLVALGFILIGASQMFRFEWAKVQIDRLVAEVGALLLVVGVLHWFFEFGLRKEMLREVADAVVGSTLLHDSGLERCSMNSRQVDDRAHWSRCANLTIGRQYSPRFFKDFHDVLKDRCANKLPTTVTILHADGAAARYLHDSVTGNPTVGECTDEIAKIFEAIDAKPKKYIRLLLHDRVLRYSFVLTDESVWVTFFTNSPERASVPALKVRAGTPLFEFFAEDIKRLLGHCREPE